MRFVSRNLLGYKLTHSLSGDENFHISGQSRTTGEVTTARLITKSGKSRLVRGRPEINTETSVRYKIITSLRGEFEVSQFGQTAICRPSSLVMLSGTEEIVHSKGGNNDTVCVLLPEEFVDQRLANAESKCARPIDMTKGLGHLAFNALAHFPDDAQGMSDVEFQIASRLIGELVLLTLGGASDVSSQTPSIRSANLSRVKKTIRKNLADPDLSLVDIAVDCGISLSYMHNLFRDDKQSAWEFLKSERLQRARQMMLAAGSSKMTVTEIAFSCGFSNMSQFSTAFKRAFSVSPRDVLRVRKEGARGI
jgi:AraC-like DNA-binding protein